MKEYKLIVNGLKVDAKYEEYDVENLFKPLIKELASLQKEKNRRIFVFLAAPAGIGKTTLAVFLKDLAEKEGIDNFSVVGIDGFHYYNDYLNSNYVKIEGKDVLLRTIKGNKVTFDVDKLEKYLLNSSDNDIYWPVYDRTIHNPVENACLVDGEIVLLEGNYLLLKDENWARLRKYCDYSIFISCNKEMLNTRLVNRKIAGGLSEDEAILWYESSDKINVEMVLNDSIRADINLFYDGKNYIRKIIKRTL